GLVAARPDGRHRHYRLTRPEAVRALEALAVLAPGRAPRTHRQAAIGRAVRAARTCYDHLAGRAGVALTAALVERRALRPAGPPPRGGGESTPTEAGGRPLASSGPALPPPPRPRRAFALACLDWSERVDHLAGSLGAALLARLLELGWIVRMQGSRAVQLSP